jgi:hypothetical protein
VGPRAGVDAVEADIFASAWDRTPVVQPVAIPTELPQLQDITDVINHNASSLKTFGNGTEDSYSAAALITMLTVGRCTPEASTTVLITDQCSQICVNDLNLSFLPKRTNRAHEVRGRLRIMSI